MPSGLSITGVILADHIKSLDWNERRVRPAGKLPSHAIAEVRDRIALLLGF